MDIPVYLIAGFLDAGKTSFINGILRDGFAAEDRTLLLCCEEGELGYDPHVLSNVFTYTVEDQEELTPADCHHRSTRLPPHCFHSGLRKQHEVNPREIGLCFMN